MSHTRLIYHVIFATKYRDPIITPELEQALHPHLNWCIRALGGTPLAVNGVADHVHLVFGLKPTVTVSYIVAHTKARTSRRLNDGGPSSLRFAWQDGYAAFTVNPYYLSRLLNYVRDQKRHHGDQSIEPENEWDDAPTSP